MLLLSRYECKYLVRSALLPTLRDMIRPFMRLDQHALNAPDHRYRVSSLYLDTADLLLCHETMMGIRNRFKLRVRSYADAPDAPVFFEIKRRINQIIRKSRCIMSRPQAEAILHDRPGRFDHLSQAQLDVVQEFESLRSKYSIGPVARLRYMREAYQSINGDPLRITFDTCLQGVRTTDVNFDTNGGGWATVDLPDVILEIKFTERFPVWVHQVIQCLGLQRESVPKYVMVMQLFTDAPLENQIIPVRMRG